MKTLHLATSRMQFGRWQFLLCCDEELFSLRICGFWKQVSMWDDTNSDQVDESQLLLSVAVKCSYFLQRGHVRLQFRLPRAVEPVHKCKFSWSETCDLCGHPDRPGSVGVTPV